LNIDDGIVDPPFLPSFIRKKNGWDSFTDESLKSGRALSGTLMEFGRARKLSLGFNSSFGFSRHGRRGFFARG